MSLALGFWGVLGQQWGLLKGSVGPFTRLVGKVTF